MPSKHCWCEVRQVGTPPEMVLVQVTRAPDKQPCRAQQSLHRTPPAPAITSEGTWMSRTPPHPRRYQLGLAPIPPTGSSPFPAASALLGLPAAKPHGSAAPHHPAPQPLASPLAGNDKRLERRLPPTRFHRALRAEPWAPAGDCRSPRGEVPQPQGPQAPALPWDTALPAGDRHGGGTWGCHTAPTGAQWAQGAWDHLAAWGLCSQPAGGARRCCSPDFVLNVRPLCICFEFLATESLRIQVERKVSSAGA